MNRPYLESMRRHIAIVGKLKVFGLGEGEVGSDKNEIVGPTPFEDIKFNASFYACPIIKTINKTSIHTMTVKPPRAVTKEEIDRKAAKEINISGTKLKNILDERSISELSELQVAPKIGGELFVELLDALDRLAPFSHPNFDQLIIESYAIFYKEIAFRSGIIDHAGLREVSKFLEAPEIAQRVTALVRGDHNDKRLQEYRKSLSNAAKSLFEAGQFGEVEGHLEGILDILERFQNALWDDERDFIDTPILQRNVSEDERMKANLQSWSLPGLPPSKGVSAGAYIQDLFARFHRDRVTVEEMLSSEPIMAFIMNWFFWKTGVIGHQSTATAAIEEFRTKFYLGAGGSNARDKRTRLKQQKDYELGLRTGVGLSKYVSEGDAAGQAKQTVRTVLVEDMIAARMATDAPNRIYDRKKLINTLGTIYRKVSALLIAGVADKMDENREITADLRRFFRRAYESKRGKELTLEKLTAILRGSNIRIITDWLQETWDNESFLDKHGYKDLTGEELTKTFEESYTQMEWETGAARIEAFIEEADTTIVEESQRLVEAYKASLNAMNPGGKCPVPQSPPGGRRATLGILNRDKMDEELGGEAHANRGEDQPVEQAVPMAAGSGTGNPSGGDLSAGETVDTSENIETDDSKSEEASGATGERSEHSIGDGPDIDPDALFDPSLLETGELEEIQKQGELTRGDLLTDEKLDLLGSPERARQRAQWRTLIAGEFLLALSEERTPLSVVDRSLCSHFVLEMIQAIGATREFEKEGREILKKWQKVGDDDASGVFELPLSEILEIDGGEDGANQLSEFLTIWEGVARNLLNLKDDLEELQEIQEFLKALKESGNKGWVTIIYKTIDEYSKETPPIDQRIIATRISDHKYSDDSVPPPGIVWITRSGADVDSTGTVSLSGPAHSLYEHDTAPFRRLSQGRTVLGDQEKKKEKFASGALWGMPIFVGEKLSVPDPLQRNVPAISVGDLGVSGAVSILAGLSLRVGRWKGTIIGDDGAKAFKRVAKLSGTELAFGVGYKPSTAWSVLLMADDMIAAQYFSRIVSWGLLHLGNSESPKSPLDHKKAYYEAEADIKMLYPEIIEGRKEVETLRKRVTILDSENAVAGADAPEPLRLCIVAGGETQYISLRDCFVH